MKNTKTPVTDELFNPDKAFNRISELMGQKAKMVKLNKTEDPNLIKEIKGIKKEIDRLSKLHKEYYKYKIAGFKKKKKAGQV